MASVGTLDIPPELLELWRKLFRPVETRRYSAVARSGHLLSPEKKRAVSTRSLLPEISAAWAAMSPETKQAWKDAGAAARYTGWNLFVQDTAYRLKHGLDGLATPSVLHQYKCGRIEIGGSAKKVILKQYHPTTYYKMRKIRGTTGIYEPVKITENLQLPLQIAASYRANLTAYGGEPKCTFYAEITSHYQGRNIQTVAGFDLLLSTGWTRQTAQSTEVLGVARSYTLVIELDNVQGFLHFDNVVAQHTGTNYARDWRCNDVNNDLTTVNYMIEKSWEEQFLPTGAAFDSVYDDN